LWNNEPQPSPGIQAGLADVYLRHAPSLGRYEDKETQAAILLGLSQMMIESDCFQHLFAATAEICLTYTPDQSIALLSTYSPYLKLDDHTRNALLIGLKQCLLERERSVSFPFLVFQPVMLPGKIAENPPPCLPA
jgi:hypothetical protein